MAICTTRIQSNLNRCTTNRLVVSPCICAANSDEDQRVQLALPPGHRIGQQARVVEVQLALGPPAGPPLPALSSSRMVVSAASTQNRRRARCPPP
jgi:hypothetical protein